MSQARKFVEGLLCSVTGIAIAAALAACGSSGGTAAPATTTAAQTSAAASDQQGSGGALTNLTSALSAASSLAAESKNDSAAAATGSDANCPLTAAHISAATAMTWQQADYVSSCPEFGGVLQQFSTPTAVGCARDGVVVDAQVGDGTRLVQVWINTAKEKQAELAAAWEPLMAAVN